MSTDEQSAGVELRALRASLAQATEALLDGRPLVEVHPALQPLIDAALEVIQDARDEATLYRKQRDRARG